MGDIHAIVEYIYRDNRVNQLISKLEPKDLQHDLLHHCIMEMYRIEDVHPGKIEALYLKAELWPWMCGMIKQQLLSKKSTFYTKFRRQYVEIASLPAYLLKEEPNTCTTEENTAMRLGVGFMEYFYTKYPERNKKTKVLIKQAELF